MSERVKHVLELEIESNQVALINAAMEKWSKESGLTIEQVHTAVFTTGLQALVRQAKMAALLSQLLGGTPGATTDAVLDAEQNAPSSESPQ